MAEYDNKCADLDYKAEYKRLSQERENYIAEAGYLHERLRAEEQKNIVLRAKLEMVELIFGRRRDNG